MTPDLRAGTQSAEEGCLHLTAGLSHSDLDSLPGVEGAAAAGSAAPHASQDGSDILSQDEIDRLLAEFGN